MAEKLDTSWFDLNNYKALETMSIFGWAEEIRARCQYWSFVHARPSEDTPKNCDPSLYKFNQVVSKKFRPYRLRSIAKTLKRGIVKNYNNSGTHLGYKVNSRLKGDSFSTGSVNSISSYNLVKLAADVNPSSVWDACEYKSWYDSHNPCMYDEDYIPDTDLLDIADAPHDINIRQQLSSSHPLTHVEVNLSATNEQIKNDFSHWLTHYRIAIDYQIPKKLAHHKLFTQRNFDYWVKYGVIPYLDLVLIAKIEEKKVTQEEMAELIFPDEDIVDRIRETTKPEAEWLIINQAHKALSAQLLYEKQLKQKA